MINVSEAKKCDRCGKFYEVTNEENVGKVIWIGKQVDLCSECTEKLHNWLDGNWKYKRENKIVFYKCIHDIDTKKNMLIPAHSEDFEDGEYIFDSLCRKIGFKNGKEIIYCNFDY